VREEETEKKRYEHFNTIWPMIPTKQEWRVKEKISAPTFTTFDDDIDLLDDDESPLIKDGSLDRHGYQHGLYTVGKVQGCLGGDRSDVSWSQAGRVREDRVIEIALEFIVHSRSHRWEANFQDACRRRRYHQPGVVFYVQEAWKGGQRASKDQLDTERRKGATQWRVEASSPWSSLWGASRSLPHSSSSRYKVILALFLVAIGFTPIAMFLVLCTSS
jgi:hypothetical protein